MGPFVLLEVILQTRVIALFGLTMCVALTYRATAQAPRGSAPSNSATPQSGGGRGRGAITVPPLFFKETWRLDGAPHAIAPGEAVVTNPDLELKLYGPSATASDPDKRIWISGAHKHLDGHVHDTVRRDLTRQEQLCGPLRPCESTLGNARLLISCRPATDPNGGWFILRRRSCGSIHDDVSRE